MKTFLNMLRDDSGASAAEYALILAIVGSAIALAAIGLGSTISNSMNDASRLHRQRQAGSARRNLRSLVIEGCPAVADFQLRFIRSFSIDAEYPKVRIGSGGQPMKRQSLIALGIALLLGLLAVYLANIFLSRNEDKAADAAAGTSRVAVAVVPLDYGMEITPDKIRFANLPNAALPVGTYTQLNDLFPMGQKRVALRRWSLRFAMEVNEPILKTKISGEGQNASIAALLPDGKRAAAVRINDVSGVAGFVQPNDSVDVLITRQEPGGTSQKTDVLLQNTRVLALDQTAKNPDGTPQVAKSATLEVDPLDAQKLALAQQVGTLSLVLRKPGDEQNNPVVETISLDDLRYSYYGGARYANSPGAPAAAGLPRSSVAVPATPVRVVVRRPARAVAKKAPAPVRSNSVEVVRGTEGSKYEVKRYGS